MAAKMITDDRAGPLGKSVLLFSGGMDSVCFDYLLKPDVLLYAPCGARYTDAEDTCISMLCETYATIDQRMVEHYDVFDFSEFERDDMIIPNRNAHMVLLASHYGEIIYLSSVQGDRSLDKDEHFYELMRWLLNHMWDEQHWTARREFKVASPFKHLTKSELVKQYLEQDGDAQRLLISYSCYEGDASPRTGRPQHCGVCKPCARKRVALENNGIEIPQGYFAEDFLQMPWFEKLYPQMLRGEYRGAEDADFVHFAKRKGLAG